MVAAYVGIVHTNKINKANTTNTKKSSTFSFIVHVTPLLFTQHNFVQQLQCWGYTITILK